MPAHVLVAEDDPKHAEILRRYLQSAGYRTTVTHDGATALDSARRLRPDLLLIDVMMPASTASACARSCAGNRPYRC